MAKYIAILCKDADSDFGVEFPDFPGCVTAGSTLDEAGRFAEEALRLHVEGMVEDGIPLLASSMPDYRSADPASHVTVVFTAHVPV